MPNGDGCKTIVSAVKPPPPPIRPVSGLVRATPRLGPVGRRCIIEWTWRIKGPLYGRAQRSVESSSSSNRKAEECQKPQNKRASSTRRSVPCRLATHSRIVIDSIRFVNDQRTSTRRLKSHRVILSALRRIVVKCDNSPRNWSGFRQ